MMNNVINLLKAFQSTLAASFFNCDEDEQDTWKAIDSAISDCEQVNFNIQQIISEIDEFVKETLTKPTGGTSGVYLVIKAKLIQLSKQYGASE